MQLDAVIKQLGIFEEYLVVVNQEVVDGRHAWC
jgi:hypothetical protein